MDDILFDYSKNIITDETLELLLQLANECQLKDAINAMFNGEKINETENRSVLHMALAKFFQRTVYAEGNRCNARGEKSIAQNENLLRRRS